MSDTAREFEDIQAVVRGFGRERNHSLYHFLNIKNAAQARKCLYEVCKVASVLDRKSTETSQVSCNVAFTYRGLERLGVNGTLLASFPSDFREGMAARALENGDVEDSAPNHWEEPFRLVSEVQGKDETEKEDADANQPLNEDDPINRSGVDVLVIVYASSEKSLRYWLSRFKYVVIGTKDYRDAFEEGPDNKWCGVYTQFSSRLQTTRSKPVHLDDPSCEPPPGTLLEHFGFNDSVTAVSVKGLWDNIHPKPSATRVSGHGKFEDGRWKPIAAGEFLFGHIDEVDELPIAPQPSDLSHNGTFLVFRKLEQHVERFREYVKYVAKQHGVSADYVAQKLVGRRRDGYSYNDPDRINNFRFDFDKRGYACPLGAHIRRANPRDSLGFGTLLINRHRILRRSMPYGGLVSRDEKASDEGRGLIFIALGVSISRQFEFIQRQWMNFGNDLDQGAERDPIVGSNDESGSMIIPGSDGMPTVVCKNIPRFVDTKGGDYFFLPGVFALSKLLKDTYGRKSKLAGAAADQVVADPGE